MANKTIKRISVSVQADIELTDEEIAEKKRQLREYAKSLFNAGDVGINMTYEEVE